ncbi:hypothetical protein fugu_019688 [Takifugu bimaculatus]|uniref:Myb-like domain-containing protein n=1 Tax=Takifugu bimaculatus TaxID=433685 RepID=A0A4Z2BHW6_9TELE|nr:hypothetical protein fugu_019688 [Takifugu bimaculatus]
MEIKRGAENGSNRGNDLPVQYLRLLAPPLQLLSAAVWQVVQQGLVDHYGMLEEFVTMVTELVPELMSYSQKAQLIMGLRARLVLEMCRGEHPVDMQAIQPHLDRIKAPVSTAKDHHDTINQVEESEVNFVELVHSLLEDPVQRKHFFQEIFPAYFGSKYDASLEMLVWEFISRLDELLPVPDFTQLTGLLGDAPTLLNDCLRSSFQPGDMKAVLEHHRKLGHFKEKDPRFLPMDDCILSSLSLPPGAKPVINSASSPQLGDASELKGHADAPINGGGIERSSRKGPGAARQRRKDTGDSEDWQLGDGGSISRDRKPPCDEMIDLTTSGETTDTESVADDSGQSTRIARLLRKRKLSDGVDIPAKQPTEVSAFLDPSLDDENSGESPLISIWGEYTDPQEGSFSVIKDAKVPWSDEETLHLLDIWGKDTVQRALKGCLKNRHIFTQIAQKMAERGYMRSVEQCQTRIKRLKKYFRQNHKANSKMEYRFHEQLERVLGSSRTSNASEITYDVEEFNDDEESRDGDEDLQVLGQTIQREVGTRSVPWTDSETLLLINTWGEDTLQQELRMTHRTGHIFTIISNKMAAQGFSRTPEQCQTRLKRLKLNFRQSYHNNLKELEQVHCKFYNELGQILVKDFVPVQQAEELSGELDEDLSSFTPQDGESVGAVEDRKKVPWSDKETIILLEIWGDTQVGKDSQVIRTCVRGELWDISSVQVQRSIRRYPHNGHVFTEISEKLRANGYSRTPEQCHSRIKRLKSNYRQCRESISATGSDRIDFKFYDLLEQILDKQPSTSASAVETDAIEISEDSDGDGGNDPEAVASVSVEKPPPSLWSDGEILALIEIWGEEDVQRALRGSVHNGYVYAEISERMQDLGFSKTSEQCRWKVKSLRNNFRQCYDKKKCGKKVDYRFYTQLEQILGQEAVSMDEYDRRDEQADQDAAADGVNSSWTEPETVALVEVWAADDVQHSLKTCVHNSHIFAEIAEKMSGVGFPKTAEQCQSRMKRLKKTYRRYCNSRRTGRPVSFRYFNLLAPVLGDTSEYVDEDGSPADAASQPLVEKGPDVYEQGGHFLQADLSRKTPWSERETRTLLEIWGEDPVQLTLKGSQKNRHVFEYISEKMSNRGYSRTTDQCYSRIKRLKYGFLHEKQDFKFFSEMDGIFRKQLKVDDSDSDLLVPEEAEEYGAEAELGRATASAQWMPENSKQIWTDSETEALLNIWRSGDIQQMLKGSAMNKQIYSQVSELMASQGFLRTPEQCQNRIKRLKANFRQFLEGRRGERQEFKFFDQMVQLFGNKYVINSEPVAEDADDGADPTQPL